MAGSSSFLSTIVASKREELSAKKRRTSLHTLRTLVDGMPKPSSLASAISGGLSIIAEIKRKSPSQNTRQRTFDSVSTARLYEASGAAAISVVTDEPRFGSTIQDLMEVRSAVRLPILRKDFVIDEYQILESRVIGADAVLLIARILSIESLTNLLDTIAPLGMEALVEVHDEKDLIKALEAGADMIGVNNRDLDTFEVDLSTTKRLVGEIPEGHIVVSESGLCSRTQIEGLSKLGVNAFLVGEALLDAACPGAKLRELLGHVNK